MAGDGWRVRSLKNSRCDRRVFSGWRVAGDEWRVRRVVGGGSSEGVGRLGGFAVAEQTACVFDEEQIAS